MEQLLLSELAAFCGGTLIGADVPINGISTDSRHLKKGELFIPLIGQKFDAHAFLVQAATDCSAAMSSVRISLPIPLLLVPDTGRALLDIAGQYRLRFNLPVIGITGSTGKTTTKELAGSILRQRYNTLCTMGNYNNHVGVPLTLLNLNTQTQAAVIEMGMNHFGEISRLTQIVRPTTALITNIGSMHLEFLGTREGILQAKSEIFEGLPESGTVVLNADDDLLRSLEGKLAHRISWFGLEDARCSFTALNISARETGMHFILSCPDGQIPVDLPAAGIHNVYNALAAAAAASDSGVSLEDIAAGLAAFKNTGSRQRIYTHGEYTIIDDCYNAGPDSMEAALGVLAQAAATRRIAVLGSMLELGSYSPEQHLKITRRARETADLVFLFGEQMQNAALPGEYYPTHRALAGALCEAARAGDAILFKGSRGMHMEEVLSMFLEVK